MNCQGMTLRETNVSEPWRTYRKKGGVGTGGFDFSKVSKKRIIDPESNSFQLEDSSRRTRDFREA